MNFKKIMADFIAKIAFLMAKKACGTASIFGAHQVHEPIQVSEFFNGQ